MARRWLGVDHESYYDSKLGFTLRKMDVPSYLCDPRFESTGCAFKEGSNAAFFVDGPDIARYFADLGDPSDITAYSHNAMFDACLSSWRFNWRAGLNICTLALARQTIAKDLRSLSLASVAKFLGCRPKGDFIGSVDGMNRAMIKAAGLWDKYANYACDDIETAWEILNILIKQVSAEELVIADTVLTMATLPSFVLDQQNLHQYHQEVLTEKEQLMAVAMIASGCNGKDDLMSNDKLAVVLQSLGVDPPQKISTTTHKLSWAFAKSDPGMKELLEHDDPAVQAVVAARLGVKSTLEETRAARLVNIAGLDFPAFGRGVFPVPLKVSGAHTHRLSGDWKLNAQNFKRNKPPLPVSPLFPQGRPPIPSQLRKALRAPDGYVVVVGDLSQIEARMAAVYSGQWDLVEQFRDPKQDPYCEMGTNVFGRTITKTDVGERFVGKQLTLGGMYGVGGYKFFMSIKHLAREQVGIELDVDELTCTGYIEKYREKTPRITEMRYILDKCLPTIAGVCDFMKGPVRFLHNEVVGPTGLKLFYKDLQYLDNVKVPGWWFTYQQRPKYIYGGKFLENIIQFLARCVVMQALLRLRPRVKSIGGRIALQAHDEIVLVVPLTHRVEAQAMLEEELSRPVPWMPGLPVACETGFGPTYGDAK